MTHSPHGESPEGDGLLPCPFCGFAGGHYTGLHHVQRASDPYRGKTDFWIQCPNCGATVPARRADHAEERSWDLAVERWNRRAAPASPEGGSTGLERTQDQLEIALREGDESSSGGRLPSSQGGSDDLGLTPLEKELLAALKPFAGIAPSSLYPADGSEAEGYSVMTFEHDRLGHQLTPDFTGTDLAAARAAIAKAEGRS